MIQRACLQVTMPFMTHPLVLRPLTTVAPSTTVCALTSFGQLPPETRTKTVGFLTHLRIGAMVIQSTFPLSKKAALVKDYQMPANEQGLADHISIWGRRRIILI
jgi:hypothetical protein